MNAKFALFFAFCLLAPMNGARAQDAAAKPAIFVCGDSTAKNSGPGKNGNPVAGWGTPISNYFDPEKAVVKNVGHAGQSSLTYYTSDWPKVLPQIHSGDFVLLVFGINDGTTPPGLGEETKSVTVRGQTYDAHTYGGTCRKWRRTPGTRGRTYSY
jgi:lysophospholipase L1-like esterase